MQEKPPQVFFTFGRASLEKILELTEPPFVRDEDHDGLAFRQLSYVERYVGRLGCKCILLEREYIDRDYMEDHSVFYSRSLHPYKNRCQRLHFFNAAGRQIQRRLRELLALSIETHGGDQFLSRCLEFSSECYLGFSVIKPLGGCPVGRTVLKCFSHEAGNYRRTFESARNYTVHVRGVPLSVIGLAFQQQDIGVSACATTALWSALQKARDFEEIPAATPAQITRLASQYTLPFGRPMPSEGLGVDQMCVAIQSLGLAPNLFKVPNFEIARAYIYSAVRSGFAPVLILRERSATGTVYHAVTIAGLKLHAGHQPTPIAQSAYIDDRAGDLAALYIHDDRNGPYLRADILRRAGQLELRLPLGEIAEGRGENWIVTHLLVPMHSKVRISFSGLRQIAFSLLLSVSAFGQELTDKRWKRGQQTIQFETWIARGHVYVEQLVASGVFTAAIAEEFSSRLALARYVGIVSLTGPGIGTLHILVDTTSTPRNLKFIGIVRFSARQKYTDAVARLLAEECQCLVFT